MTALNRTPSGVPAGGEFAVTARAQTDVSLTPGPTEAEVILDAALARKRATDAEATTATLCVVAQKVQEAFLYAEYLTLVEDHEYGADVRAGTLLDADHRVILEGLGDLGGATAAQVDALLRNLDGLASTDGCPAIGDRFADDPAWSATGERRLHLPTAAALLETETKQAELAGFVRDAVNAEGGAASYEEATAALKESMTDYLNRTVDLAGRGAITDWLLEAEGDAVPAVATAPR